MTRATRLWVGMAALGVASASAMAQTVAGSVVSLYAEVDAPQRLSFDPATGDLYVGQGFAASISMPIRKVSGLDQTVTDFGPGIQDADAVLFDVDGSLTGTVGAVLVGSGIGLFAITPAEMMIPIIAPKEGFSNPTDFQMLNDGRLVFSDFQGAAIVVYQPNPAPVAAGAATGLAPTTEGLALNPDGTLYSTDRTGQILQYDPATLTPTVARNDAGRTYRWMVSVDQQAGFDDGLLVWDDGTNDLLLFADFDLTSDPTVVGSGFEGLKDLEFGPDGALYAALGGGRGEVVRITPEIVPAPGVLATLGLFTAVARRRRRLG